MAALEVFVPHQLGQEAAQRRVEGFLDGLQRQYSSQISNVQGQWDSNRLNFGFHFTGFAINGTVTVEEQQVRATSSLPLAAVLFRGKIENWIRDELQRLLSPVAS